MTSALPDYPAALEAALRAVTPVARNRCGIEQIPLALGTGRILAAAVSADRDLPPFHRAMMDGYAVRASDVKPGVVLRVVGEIPAGSTRSDSVPAGTCVKIATGAPLPDDCDAVIPHEWSDRGNPVRFSIERIDSGHAVHPRGADARRGDVLLSHGTLLRAHHLGIAATTGVSRLSVRIRPRAAVLTSGDEVVAANTPSMSLRSYQIRNSNAVMLTALLERMGAEPGTVVHVPDDPDASHAALRESLEHHDLVITVGGVSAGDRDHFPRVMDQLGIIRTVNGASIQPGKPIIVGYGTSPAHTIIVGLPGNPVSALACACLFIWPILRLLVQTSDPLPWRSVTLAEEVKPNAHRQVFRPAIIQSDGSAVVPSWAGSGDLTHTAPTHGLIELPRQSSHVCSGSVLRFLPWP